MRYFISGSYTVPIVDGKTHQKKSEHTVTIFEKISASCDHEAKGLANTFMMKLYDTLKHTAGSRISAELLSTGSVESYTG